MYILLLISFSCSVHVHCFYCVSLLVVAIQVCRYEYAATAAARSKCDVHLLSIFILWFSFLSMGFLNKKPLQTAEPLDSYMFLYSCWAFFALHFTSIEHSYLQNEHILLCQSNFRLFTFCNLLILRTFIPTFCTPLVVVVLGAVVASFLRLLTFYLQFHKIVAVLNYTLQGKMHSLLEEISFLCDFMTRTLAKIKSNRMERMQKARGRMVDGKECWLSHCLVFAWRFWTIFLPPCQFQLASRAHGIKSVSLFFFY